MLAHEHSRQAHKTAINKSAELRGRFTYTPHEDQLMLVVLEVKRTFGKFQISAIIAKTSFFKRFTALSVVLFHASFVTDSR